MKRRSAARAKSAAALVLSLSLLACTADSRPYHHHGSFGTFGSGRVRAGPAARRLVPWTVTMRGGDQEELTLDQKVRAAMQKLGISPPPPPPPGTEETADATATATPPATATATATPPATATATATADDDDDCVDGVCPMPAPVVEEDDGSGTTVMESVDVDEDEEEVEVSSSSSTEAAASSTQPQEEQPAEAEEASSIVERISRDMNVDSALAWAALGATRSMEESASSPPVYNEEAARNMIQQELDLIAQIPADSPQVQQLESEGFDPFLCRRALAFAEGDMEDARAILLADKMDAEEEEMELEQSQQAQAPSVQAEEEQQQQQQQQEEALPEETSAAPAFKSVAVDADFDPTKLGTTAAPSQPAAATPPPPANKADVVFDATADQIQALVLESPVPVLLDVYADWCGPCKALSPILEEMAVKGGGAFRLVKVNSDNEKAIAGALGVQALPTVFGVRDGKIQHMWEGMPKSQEFLQNFMVGLLMGTAFDPPVTASEQEKYDDLSTKLLKTAGAASFPFSARERLHDRISARLDNLETEAGVLDADTAATTVRSLLSNVIKDPFEFKFRKVNLANKAIAARVARYENAIGILRSAGFVLDSSTQSMVIGKGKKLINVAPLTVVRDCIDKWVDKTRYEVAKAARKRKDEEDWLRLQAEAEAAGELEEEETDDEEEEVDPDACTLNLRMDGKKKVHEIELRADDPLSSVLGKLPVSVQDGQEVQITCVARRLVVKSSDKSKMKQTLRELKLAPSAAIVVSVGDKTSATAGATATKLSERNAAKKKKKKGSHTMQSIGIYAKDDANKAELIDGGGGVWYEHDVSDDEEEEKAEGDEESDSEEGDEEEESSSEEGEDEEEE